MSDNPPPVGTSNRRAGVLVAVVAVSVAAMGFMAGASPDVGVAAPRPSGAQRTAEAPLAGHAPMPTYAELRGQRRGRNGEMYDGAVAALAPKDGKPADGLPMPALMPAPDRSAALAQRAQHRAFDGAPPTIPHAIVQMAVPSCLACHENGARLPSADGFKIAPRISHARYQSCTQCHVPETESKPLDGGRTPIRETTFLGLAPGGGGTRAWPGAPPTIPHRTLMRSECGSCHGPGGRFGLRTPHPDRSNCLQCHALSAELDQRGRP